MTTSRVHASFSSLVLLALASLSVSGCIDVPASAYDDAPDVHLDVGGYTTFHLRGGDDLPEGLATAALGEPDWDAALPPGASFVVRVLAFAGETLHVAATPISSGSGDPVVAIHGRDRAEILRSTATSRRAEVVHLARVATTGPHYITVTCPAGVACPSLELFLSRGDDNALFTASSTATYINQRSFRAEDARRCTVLTAAGTSHAIGECMCAPSSASMRMASLGVVTVDEARGVSEDLFTTKSRAVRRTGCA